MNKHHLFYIFICMTLSLVGELIVADASGLTVRLRLRDLSDSSYPLIHHMHNLLCHFSAAKIELNISSKLCDNSTEDWLSIAQAILAFPQYTSPTFIFDDTGIAWDMIKLHAAAIRLLHCSELQMIWKFYDDRLWRHYEPLSLYVRSKMAFIWMLSVNSCVYIRKKKMEY
jgi:hypothetical protein